MTALLRRHLCRFRYRKITSRPQTDIVRKCTSRTHQIIRNTLNTGNLHIIGVFNLIKINDFLRRCITLQQPLDHKLQKSIFSGKLRTSHSHTGLKDLINCVSLICTGTGQLNHNMVLSKPLYQLLKTCIDL